MKKGEVVYELIQAMTPTEKRYFKNHYVRYASNGDSKYESLFDVLNAMKGKYDANTVKIRFPAGTNLPAWHSHLYESLLRSLRGFYSQNLVQIEVLGLQTDALILQQKGLLGQAGARIKKMEKIAGAHSLEMEELKVNYFKRKMLRNNIKRDSLRALEALQAEGHEILDLLRSEFLILDYYERIFWAIQAGNAKERQEMLQEAVAMFKGIPSPRTLTLNARVCYYGLSGLYHHYRSEYPEAKQFQLDLIRLFEEEYPNMIDEYQSQYLNAINNYLNNCFRNKDFAEVRTRLHTLSRLKIKNADSKRLIEETFLYSWQKLHLESLDFAAVIKLAPEIDEFLTAHPTAVRDIRQLVFQYNTIVAYFLEATLNAADEHEYSLLVDEALEKIFAFNQISRYDIYQTYKIKTNLIAAALRIELGDYTLAEAILRNILSRSEPKSLERRIIRALQRYLAAPPDKRRKILERLAQEPGLDSWMSELAIWIKGNHR